MWPFKKKKQTVVTYLPRPTIGSLEWRRVAENRNLANRLFMTPEFMAILSILVHERPSKLELPIGAPQELLANQAMFTAGYEFAIQQMLALGQEANDPNTTPEMRFEE